MLDIFIIAASIHIGGGDFNEINPGVAVRYENYVAGVYENSFSDTSVIIGRDVGWQRGDLEYGLIAGGVTGYDMDWTVGGVTAFVAPYVSYDLGPVKPTVLVLDRAITFSVGMEF